MAQIPPIDDAYINEIIKSNGPYNPALLKTQGIKMRELIKWLRDRMEQGDAEAVHKTGDESISGTKTFTLIKAEGLSINNLSNPSLDTVISPVTGVQTKLLNITEGAFSLQLSASVLAASRSQLLQDKDGVVALTEDLSDFLTLSQFDEELALKIDNTARGVAGGVSTLDSGGKIPASQLPDSISGALTYQGTWDATTNVPALVDPPASSSKGYYYVTNTAGTQFGITFAVGDWIVSNGTAWEKVDNSDAVTTVFGRLGNILANATDYAAYYPSLTGAYVNPSWITSLPYSKITGTPAPGVSAINSIGTVPNLGGASISESQLTLQPASVNFGGVVTTEFQTFAGEKSFSQNIYVNGLLVGRGYRNIPSNVVMGSFSMNSATGGNNVAYGNNAGQRISTGTNNVAIGAAALSGNTTGSNNTAVGYSATGTNNFTGNNNTTIGASTDFTSGTWENSTALGSGAQINASNKIQLGNTSVTLVNTSGSYQGNGFIKTGGTASQFLKADGTVDLNTYATQTSVNLKQNALVSGTNIKTINGTTLLGSGDLVISGSGVPYSGATGPVNLGPYTLTVSTLSISRGAGGASITGSVAIGNSGTLGSNTTGIENIAIGNGVLDDNTTGSRNVAIGQNALKSGNSSVAIGNNSLTVNTATNNTAVGYNSLSNNITGVANAALGHGALTYNTSGSLNVGIGSGALHNNTSGSNNTAIGYQAGVSVDALTNTTAIGYMASVDASNRIQLGNSSVTLINTSGAYKGSQFRLSALNTAPATATSAGEAFEIRFAADGIYLCTATNTWVKVALATW